MNQQLGINRTEIKTFIEPNLKTIQKSIDRGMDKQTMTYSY